ncbi:MAG: adenylate/guanylate cyclase domain-containing protein [Candidatus Edwardsbacteria bacterium]|nr:adenylate/guanylate cyclase domain-containing protein [Candidatus Edwardsbacteria bacterium]
MEQRELVKKILEKLDHITGRESSLLQGDLEQAVFAKLGQVEKIISSIQKYLPKRVIDKILLNPDGVKVEGERRQVTVLFGDLSGFTAMSETMDPEQVVEVVNQYFDTMVEIASRYGGHIDKFMGDALMVLFGAPVAHEDDPLRACMAAIEMLEAMDRFSAERKMDLAMSIGLNTGEVVALNVGSKERMEYTVIGDGVNLAARLEKVATARECVIGENTYRQVKGKIKLKKLKPVMVKGKSKPQNVYLIQGRMDEAGQASTLRAGSIKLVGRMAEMDSIKQALANAKDSRGQVVAITGDPGVGKSRIAKELELLARDQGFKFIKGKCHSYSNNAAYLPFIRQMHLVFNIEEKDSSERKLEKIQEMLHMLDLGDFESFLGSLLGINYPEIEGLDPEKRKRKTFEGIQELYLRLSKKQPLALAFEDLQWADTLSLELLEHLVDATAGQALLICADFRPELALPFIGKPYCLNINLKPLGKQEAWQMVSALAAVSDVEDQVLNKLLERTEGNPLFIEEVIRHLISRRLVRREGESLVPSKRFGKMTLPNTVASVVLGRIDKLGEELRRVLQYSAVIGKEFDRTVLAKLLKQPEEKIQSLLDSLEHFEGLLYSKLVDTRRVYEFHSTTTHEAAYSTLLKQRRKELHGKVAMTLENDYRDNLFFHLEDLAHHYYNSSNQDKALSYLHRAGDKSRGLYANPEAIEFYEKGLTVLKALKENDDRLLEKAEILGAQGAIYRLIGEMSRALKNLNQAVKVTAGGGNSAVSRKYTLEVGIIHDMLGQADRALVLWQKVQKAALKDKDKEAQALSLQNQGLLCLRKGDPAKAVEDFQTALKVFEELKVKKHIARINSHLAQAQEVMGNLDKAIEHNGTALAISQEINYLEGIASYNNNLGINLLMTGSIEQAAVNFRTAYNLAGKIGDRRVEALAGFNLGNCQYIMGNYDSAHEYYQGALASAREIGDIAQQMNIDINLGCLQQVRGNAKAALEYHTNALEIALKIGDRNNELETKRNLGIDLSMLADYGRARAEFESGLKLALEIGDPRMVAYIRANYGLTMVTLRDLNQAEKLLSEALEDARKVGDPEVILSVVRGFIELNQAKGDFGAGRQEVDRALRISGDTHNKRERAYALMYSALLMVQQNEHEGAATPISEALTLAREMNDGILLCKLYLISARRSLVCGSFNEAQMFISDAREEAAKSGAREEMAESDGLMARLKKMQGLEEEAETELARQRNELDDIARNIPEYLRKGYMEARLSSD